jgi:hypothetical protein
MRLGKYTPYRLGLSRVSLRPIYARALSSTIQEVDYIFCADPYIFVEFTDRSGLSENLSGGQNGWVPASHMEAVQLLLVSVTARQF